MTETTAAQREKLVADLKVVIADAEELIRVGVGQTSEEAKRLSERLQERLASTKESIVDARHAAVDKARAAGHAADDYVHEKPWTAVGLGVGVGLIVGLLIGRR